MIKRVWKEMEFYPKIWCKLTFNINPHFWSFNRLLNLLIDSFELLIDKKVIFFNHLIKFSWLRKEIIILIDDTILMLDFELDRNRRPNSDCLESELSTIWFWTPNRPSLQVSLMVERSKFQVQKSWVQISASLVQRELNNK